MSSASAPPPAQDPGSDPAQPAPGSSTTGGFRMARTVTALILREMGSRYGRSPGGYVWAVLEPISMIGILAVGFSLIARSPPLGTSFILFFGTGFALFNVYNDVAATVARSLIYSRALLSYPIVSWVDALTARFLLNALTGIMVLYLILTGLILLQDDPILIDLQPIVEAVSFAMLLGLGIGTLNCALIGLFTLWDKVWGIISRPLFLVSGVIFLYEDMPPLAQDILWYNPLMHVIGRMRTGFYPTYEAAYFSPAYVGGFALVCLFFGVVLLGRYHRFILSR